MRHVAALNFPGRGLRKLARHVDYLGDLEGRQARLGVPPQILDVNVGAQDDRGVDLLAVLRVGRAERHRLRDGGMGS